jgi:hypothetical protein
MSHYEKFQNKMNLRVFNVLLFLWRGGREKGVQVVVNMKDKFMEVSFKPCKLQAPKDCY